MHEHGIPSPKKVAITFEIEIIYNSSEYEDTSDVLADVYEIVSNAARHGDVYLHFNEVTLIELTEPEADV